MDIVAAVEWCVAVSGFGPPDLGGHVDHQRLRESSGMGRGRSGDEAMLNVEDGHQGLLDVTWVGRVSCVLLNLVDSFLSFVDGGDGGRSRSGRDWIGLGRGTRREGG